MSLVVPFPRSRHRGFILRHAEIMARASTAAKAEAHLQRQLAVQRETLLRRGVTAEISGAELCAIEGNIRAACWRLLLSRGGAA